MALVDLRTRITRQKAAELGRLAKLNERSLAAELRVAIDRHLESHPKGERK